MILLMQGGSGSGETRGQRRAAAPGLMSKRGAQDEVTDKYFYIFSSVNW